VLREGEVYFEQDQVVTLSSRRNHRELVHVSLLPGEVAFEPVSAKVLWGLSPELVVPLLAEDPGLGVEFILPAEKGHLFEIRNQAQAAFEEVRRKTVLRVGDEVPLLGPVDEDAP